MVRVRERIRITRIGKKFRKFFGVLNNTTRSGPRKRPALPLLLWATKRLLG